MAWSPGEVEILDTIDRDTHRRAALEVALGDCEDVGSSRALKLAQEIRLIEAQTSRLVRQLQRELHKLLAQAQKPEEPQQPRSVVSLKAKRAADTRWHRHRLQQAANQQEFRQPEETG